MPAEFVKVARAGDVEDGELLLVDAAGDDILLARVGDAYYAIGPFCSHALGPLELGDLYGYELECPLHQGRFDVRTGHPTREPPEEPIVSYAVRVEDGDILVGPKKG